MNLKAYISENRKTYKYFWFAGEKNKYDIYVTITISKDLNTNINFSIYNDDFRCKMRSIKKDFFMTYSNIFDDFITDSDSKYSLDSVKFEDVISFEIFINDCIKNLSIYYGL